MFFLFYNLTLLTKISCQLYTICMSLQAVPTFNHVRKWSYINLFINSLKLVAMLCEDASLDGHLFCGAPLFDCARPCQYNVRFFALIKQIFYVLYKTHEMPSLESNSSLLFWRINSYTLVLSILDTSKLIFTGMQHIKWTTTYIHTSERLEMLV